MSPSISGWKYKQSKKQVASRATIKSRLIVFTWVLKMDGYSTTQSLSKDHYVTYSSSPSNLCSRGSAVGKAAGCRMDNRGSEFESRWGQECPFSTSSRRALQPNQPAIQWAPRVKRQQHEADHSPPKVRGRENADFSIYSFSHTFSWRSA
jgi:hypothetical protein